jgi:Threonine dehydrogenase and related Zn-dependent dehydrogenases
MPKSADLLDAVPQGVPSRGNAKHELTTQAAALVAPRQFQVGVQTLPPCAPDEVRIALEGCGVCASSLPVWEGRPWFEYPQGAGTPGHEGWGQLLAMGDQVPRLRPDLAIGQRVTCLGNQAFARHMNTAAVDVAVLPPALDQVPFPGEAIGCAMNIFQRADIQPGQSVAIIGAGFLGLLLVQLAAGVGARVLVMSRRESARQLAMQYGAQACFDTEDWWGNAHEIVQLTEGLGCERVIEVTGLQFALDTATEMIAEYGRLVIAGYHQDGLRQVNMQKWNWRAIDVVNAHERDHRRYMRGIKAGIAATAAGSIKPQELLTHCFSLDQLDDAFQMMVDRPDGFIKGWIKL